MCHNAFASMKSVSMRVCERDKGDRPDEREKEKCILVRVTVCDNESSYKCVVRI